MNSRQQQQFYALALAVRRLFHSLGQGASMLHGDLGISGGMRAVLESVITGGPQAVPELARARPVSRQHIQTLVNELLDAGCVKYVENPAHKRSKLVSPTAKGRETFDLMRQRERDAFRSLTIEPSAGELEAATGVLQSLIESFGGDQWESIVDNYVSKETDNARNSS